MVKTTGQLNTLQELKLHSKICDGVVFSIDIHKFHESP